MGLDDKEVSVKNLSVSQIIPQLPTFAILYSKTINPDFWQK